MKKTLTLIVVLVIIALAFVCGHHIGESSTESVNRNAIEMGSVIVPGYDIIRTKSDDQSISMELYNPEKNNCLMLVSLYLPNGKEIFKSDLLCPGDVLDYVQLSNPIPVGIYENSVLRYSCYTTDGSLQLNKVDINFTLEVTQ